MQRFTELEVWRLAQDLAATIYQNTASFPADEKFGLTSQVRRAAVSISCNIAEGSKREGSRDYARFLNVAEGSLAEVESLCFLSRRLGFLQNTPSADLFERIDLLARKLHALRLQVTGARRSTP
ncbi:MAG: four helix bundle protein [Planctomycetes bacterium]|nr:four helix bundle protein [Planctomycetota bacterium]